ncbi:MAG: hypothetical protein ACTS4W_00355 [Candidatus Hodgkinia cicadicola]
MNGTVFINAKGGFKSLQLIPYDGGELVYYRIYIELTIIPFVKVSMALQFVP